MSSPSRTDPNPAFFPSYNIPEPIRIAKNINPDKLATDPQAALEDAYMVAQAFRVAEMEKVSVQHYLEPPEPRKVPELASKATRRIRAFSGNFNFHHQLASRCWSELVIKGRKSFRPSSHECFSYKNYLVRFNRTTGSYMINKDDYSICWTASPEDAKSKINQLVS